MTKYNIPSSVAISESGFLFLPTTGETFTLNETGCEIVKLFQAGKSVPEIIKTITSEYEVQDASIEKDLNEFIAQLSNFNLIKEL